MATSDAHDPPSISHFTQQCEPQKGGCLLWRGPTSPTGRPTFNLNNRTLGVARYIYDLTHGVSDAALFVEAQCGHILCVAPIHLRQVRKAQSYRRHIGVPLPHGKTVRTAGYVLLRRPDGSFIWEPKDVARAVLEARGENLCRVCGVFIPRRGKVYCGKVCQMRGGMARKAGRPLGKPNPGSPRALV